MDHITVGNNAVFSLDTVILILIPTQTNLEKENNALKPNMKITKFICEVRSPKLWGAVQPERERSHTHREILKSVKGNICWCSVHEGRNLQTCKDKLLAGFVTKFCRRSFAKWAFHHLRWKLSMQYALSRWILTVWQYFSMTILTVWQSQKEQTLEIFQHLSACHVNDNTFTISHPSLTQSTDLIW